VDVAALRRHWGLQDAFVIGAFGPFTNSNSIKVCLRAFKHFLGIRPEARCLLVGTDPEGHGLAETVRVLDLEEQVVFTGRLPAAEFARHLLVPDLILYLRHSYSGGTLQTPLRLLGLGRPTILSEIEPLAGFLEGCCAKVPPGEGEEDLLLALIVRLAEDKELRRRLGDNARRFVQHHHGVSQVARQHLDLFKDIATGAARPVRTPADWTRGLTREVGSILADWGLEETSDALLSPIARAIEDLFPLFPETAVKERHMEESH
jgi:glycosyltransferase involved in cell wall biosynthesis